MKFYNAVKKYGVRSAVGVGALSLSHVAAAALPVEATTAIDGLAADAPAMVAEYWPIIAGVTISFILIKLFKRGGNKV